MKNPTLIIQPRRTAQILAAVAAVIAIFTFIGRYLTLFPDAFTVNTPMEAYILDNYFILEFKVNIASNVVVYFSAFILLIAVSALFFMIALYKNAIKDEFKRSWFFFGAFFLYLSINKASSLPLKNTQIFTTWTDANGWFAFRWIFIAAALTILGFIFHKFIQHFDVRFKKLLAISIALYYAGMLGTELFSGYYTAAFNPQTLTLAIITCVSEFFEFSGLILLIYTLLHYMELNLPQIQFLMGTKSQPAGAQESS